MTYAYRCPQTGLVDFCDTPDTVCPLCQKKHTIWQCGPSPLEEGAPNVIGDHLTPYMDWGAGQMIDSRSQRERVYEQKGLRSKSVAEHRQQHGGFEKPPAIYSYRGQKSHKSRLEGVRTKTGQQVI